MKKLFSFCFALMLSTQLTFAQSHETLKSLVDEYTYAMTVEWDQQDQAFALEQQKKFELSFQELYQQGITINDLRAVLPLNWKKLEAEIALLDLNRPETIREFLKQNSQHSAGASWNGQILGPSIVLGLTAVFVGWLIYESRRINKEFDSCVEANGGNEAPCIRR